jgi:hypothetical protein
MVSVECRLEFASVELRRPARRFAGARRHYWWNGANRIGAPLCDRRPEEDVVCDELSRSGFDLQLSECPAIATRVLGNLSRELACRSGGTTQDLGNLS